jgi:hypothetical protein
LSKRAGAGRINDLKRAWRRFPVIVGQVPDLPGVKVSDFYPRLLN